MGYVADMLDALAEMAISEGEASVAVSIQMAALQASQAEHRLRLRSTSGEPVPDVAATEPGAAERLHRS